MNFDQAACIGLPLDKFFTDGNRVSHTVRNMCASCPVRQECLEYVMDFEGDAGRPWRYGFFGGLTAEERYQLYRVSAGRPVKPKHVEVVDPEVVQQWMSARVGL